MTIDEMVLTCITCSRNGPSGPGGYWYHAYPPIRVDGVPTGICNSCLDWFDRKNMPTEGYWYLLRKQRPVANLKYNDPFLKRFPWVLTERYGPNRNPEVHYTGFFESYENAILVMNALVRKRREHGDSEASRAPIITRWALRNHSG